MSKSENLLAVIHLSATAVYVVVGDVVAKNDIRIKGVGEITTEDFQQGQIKHFERLKNAIRQAVIQAEEMANCRIHSVWLTLSTPELLSANAQGNVVLNSEEVETQHIVQALSAAKMKSLPNTHYLMHHCQQGVFLDDKEQMLDDAIGNTASKLTVMYHLMMMPVISRQNVQKLIQACDISIDHMLFDAVSSAEYSLIPEEREQGVCLIDIGASTTSLCVYRENKLVYTHCIPEGGNKVTMDISAELGITMLEAEKLKIQKGTVDTLDIDPSRFETFSRVGMADEITVNVSQLAQIIEARYIELYRVLFQAMLDNDLLDYIQRGVVLTGGGSQIRGMIRFSRRLLQMPVVMTTTHKAITAHNPLNDEDTFKELNARVGQRSLQTAYGALLYSQSEQFKDSEKSTPDALKVNKLSKIKTGLNNFFKNII